MLNINISDSRTYTKVEATGSLEDIMAELTFVIHDIHNALHHQDPRVAKVFRQDMTLALTDFESPVWQVDKPSGTCFVMSMPNTGKEG